MLRKLLGVISLDFDITGPLLIKYSAFVKDLRKNWNTLGRPLFMDFKKAYHSFRREVMYNILSLLASQNYYG